MSSDSSFKRLLIFVTNCPVEENARSDSMAVCLIVLQYEYILFSDGNGEMMEDTIQKCILFLIINYKPSDTNSTFESKLQQNFLLANFSDNRITDVSSILEWEMSNAKPANLVSDFISLQVGR
ncbi:hypothetical protein TNCV_2835001 [Trichonephila clavipes]|nr:hypothetical protein TNCV_2835001 [Trichonephila clavipes]